MSRDIFVMRQTWCVCCSESAMASIGVLRVRQCTTWRITGERYALEEATWDERVAAEAVRGRECGQEGPEIHFFEAIGRARRARQSITHHSRASFTCSVITWSMYMFLCELAVYFTATLRSILFAPCCDRACAMPC